MQEDDIRNALQHRDDAVQHGQVHVVIDHQVDRFQAAPEGSTKDCRDPERAGPKRRVLPDEHFRVLLKCGGHHLHNDTDASISRAQPGRNKSYPRTQLSTIRLRGASALRDAHRIFCKMKSS